MTDPQPPNLFNLTIGGNAVLDASGMWVNNSGANLEQIASGAYVDGGSISLKTDTAVSACTTAACKGLAGLGTAALVDITANIVLDSGSRLDLSSGGRIGVNGQFQTDSSGRAVGKGGSLTLETYATGFRAAGRFGARPQRCRRPLSYSKARRRPPREPRRRSTPWSAPTAFPPAGN